MPLPGFVPRALRQVGAALFRPRLRALDVLVAGGLTAWAAARADAVRAGAPQFPLGPDAGLWMEAGIGLLHGDVAAVAVQGRPVGYPALLAASYATDGDAVRATLGVAVGCWAATYGAAWLAGVALAGRVGAAVAVALLWWSAALATPAAMVNSQATFNLCLALWLALGAALLARRGVGARVLGGVGVGALVLVKEQAILVAGIFGLASLARGAWGGGPGFGARVRASFAAGVLTAFGIVLGALPQVYLAYVEYGLGGRLPKLLLPLSDFLTSKHLPNPLAGLHGAGAPPLVGTHGITESSVIGSKAADAFFADVAPLPHVAAAGLAVALLAGSPRARARAVWTAAHLLPLAPALALGFFYPYHISFLVLPFALLAGQGVAALAPRPAVDGKAPRLAVQVARAALVVAALAGVVVARTPDRDVELRWEKVLSGRIDAVAVDAWREAAAALGPLVPAGARIASTQPGIARVLGGVPTDLCHTPLDPSWRPDKPGSDPCDTFAVYAEPDQAKFWPYVRLQPPDRVPLGWTLVWRSPGSNGTIGVITAIFRAGVRPDDPVCASGEGPYPPARLCYEVSLAP